MKNFMVLLPPEEYVPFPLRYYQELVLDWRVISETIPSLSSPSVRESDWFSSIFFEKSLRCYILCCVGHRGTPSMQQTVCFQTSESYEIYNYFEANVYFLL